LMILLTSHYTFEKIDPQIYGVVNSHLSLFQQYFGVLGYADKTSIFFLEC